MRGFPPPDGRKTQGSGRAFPHARDVAWWPFTSVRVRASAPMRKAAVPGGEISHFPAIRRENGDFPHPPSRFSHGTLLARSHWVHHIHTFGIHPRVGTPYTHIRVKNHSFGPENTLFWARKHSFGPENTLFWARNHYFRPKCG